MSETSETLDGVQVFTVFTADDNDAREQLMQFTGRFLDMLEHACRFHPAVVTGNYLGDVLDDLDHIQRQFDLPAPVHPACQ
jgi:hypothetical protein